MSISPPIKTITPIYPPVVYCLVNCIEICFKPQQTCLTGYLTRLPSVNDPCETNQQQQTHHRFIPKSLTLKLSQNQKSSKSLSLSMLPEIPMEILDDTMVLVELITEIDDEAAERHQSELDRVMREFEDEPYVEHDTIPDTDSDEDYDNPVHQETRRRNFKRGDGVLFKGQTFFNGVAFKEQVIDYALCKCRNLYQYRFDKKKLGFKCYGDDPEAEACQFQVYASILPTDPIWRIRKFHRKHSCTKNGDCTLLRVPVIARLFVDKIRDEPDYYKPMKIGEMIFRKWGISCTRDQIQAARCNALRWIDNEYDQQFARLRDYVAELEVSNENSSVELQTVLNEEGNDVFDRFYVCFDVLRKTWKATCRKIIGVDGTFLKHKIKGQLLVAVGRDSNNAIYPIAWGVVQVENTDNWVWFMQKLKKDLELGDGDGYIMVSDRQKGLIKAVELELPEMEHRMCVRHIYGNLKKKHGTDLTMKPLIWSLAWSYNHVEYTANLDRLKKYNMSVYDDVMKTNPKTWCRAFQKKGSFCEDVDNNPTESFNGTVKKAREMPFVPMLELIATQAMVRIARRSTLSQAHSGVCTPYVAKFFKKELKEAKKCKISRSTNGMFQSKLFGCNFTVDLKKRTCSCKKWEVCGIPCQHAYGVILEKNLTPGSYVCDWFKTVLWRKNYRDGLVPVRGAAFWPGTETSDVHPPLGKNKKLTKAERKRKRGVNESPSKQQQQEPGKKRTVRCGTCHELGHNSRFHKKDQMHETNGTGVSQAGPSTNVVQSSQVSMRIESSQVSQSQA